MSSNKKKLILNTVSVDLGCGSCKKPRLLSQIFNPKPKVPSKTTAPTYQNHTNLYYYYYNTSSTSSKTNPSPATDYDTVTTFSPAMNSTPRPVRGLGRVDGESVAVEKDSDDPYLDFRHSMLQMILENEIYSKEDLQELLNCFLQLNSPYHHGFIVRAFTQIWNGVFSVKASGENLHSSWLRDFKIRRCVAVRIHKLATFCDESDVKIPAKQRRLVGGCVPISPPTLKLVFW
ncbi:hypothetical protein K2173_010506 [Erythroxylum novogranatense]|uniref:Transcription repressor n=1 Tax=Erythroxylum novogranatense TaxID=1862640 RepID=A0AAV8UCT7_9ROSI|nr:hypothetical protein K2173_010506 [Erythroxylum novogranatense]